MRVEVAACHSDAALRTESGRRSMHHHGSSTCSSLRLSHRSRPLATPFVAAARSGSCTQNALCGICQHRAQTGFGAVSALTGWTNHFELCCNDQIVLGISEANSYLHNAGAGEMVQITCSDAQ